MENPDDLIEEVETLRRCTGLEEVLAAHALTALMFFPHIRAHAKELSVTTDELDVWNGWFKQSAAERAEVKKKALLDDVNTGLFMLRRGEGAYWPNGSFVSLRGQMSKEEIMAALDMSEAEYVWFERNAD